MMAIPTTISTDQYFGFGTDERGCVVLPISLRATRKEIIGWMDTRTGVERIAWSSNPYTKNDDLIYASIDHCVIARVQPCPADWSVRFYCVPSEKGGHIICKSHAAGMRAVTEWVRGLDIEEWPASAD